MRRQCELLGLNRSGLYYEPAVESPADLRLMRMIDEQYLEAPFYGSRRMTARLKSTRRGGQSQASPKADGDHGPRGDPSRAADHDAERRPQGVSVSAAGLDGRTSRSGLVDRRDLYPARSGFMYLAAVIDWYSRFVLSWRLSNTLDGRFCLEASESALEGGRPEIFNTDQGCNSRRRPSRVAWSRKGSP